MGFRWCHSTCSGYSGLLLFVLVNPINRNGAKASTIQGINECIAKDLGSMVLVVWAGNF